MRFKGAVIREIRAIRGQEKIIQQNYERNNKDEKEGVRHVGTIWRTVLIVTVVDGLIMSQAGERIQDDAEIVESYISACKEIAKQEYE